MSILAEQNIIGALLVDSSKIEKLNNVSHEMFTNELLGTIFLEYQRAYDMHKEINIAVLYQKLTSEDYPQEIISDVVKECMRVSDTTTSVFSYAEVIINEYKANKLAEIISLLKISPSKVNEQIGELQIEIESLLENTTYTSKTLAEIAKENKDLYFKDNNSQKMFVGFEKLDELIGGLEGGDMVVIGARPAVGKSALVTQITSNIAKQGKRVGFYNLEMQNKQMYERFVVNESGISLKRLRRAIKFLGDEKERFDKANETLFKADNIVITTGSKKISEIRNESRHMNYDVIIIDYMQLVKADQTYHGNRYAEVGSISKAIKALAMELNIPIIALSQLNRVSEGKETKEPTMAELRETGDIEQDASVIILLWNLNEDRIKKGCKVEKNRQGESGKIVMDFDGGLMRFVETDESVEEAASWKKVKEDDSCPFE